MMSHDLLLLPLCLWGWLHGTSGQYCVDQPVRIELPEGGSVTIPFQFTFPKSKSRNESTAIIIETGDRYFCGRNENPIYDSNTGILSPAYQGRVNVQWDLNHRNASITINNVTKEDATNYCFGIERTFISKRPRRWQNQHGTQLIVRDRNDPNLETILVMFAAPGENVTLLSHFTSNRLMSFPKVTACSLMGAIDPATPCIQRTHIGKCTYQDNSLSYQMKRVTGADEAFYCWKVEIATNDEVRNTYYYLGPRLIIRDKTNTLNITQPEEVEFQGSAIISCSFTVQQDNYILQTEVYWMMGDARESYVYHPNPDYIHPHYRGKTRLVDGSNLLLEDFRGPDNTVYCRVIILHCPESQEYRNQIVTILEEGPGTHLIVEGTPGVFSVINQPVVVLGAYVGLKTFFTFLFSVLAVVYVKKM